MHNLSIDKIILTSVLEPIDQELLKDALTTPPFVVVEGVANIRDLGGIIFRSQDGKTFQTKRGKIFRSAQLIHITPDGKKALTLLNVGAVFDMRSLYEARQNASADDNAPNPGFPDLTLEGIVLHRAPIIPEASFGPGKLAKALLRFSEGDLGLVALYGELLDTAGDAFEQILRYLLQQADGLSKQACIFNCTIGKDRTGVVAALILMLLEVPDDLIARDYALTRIGLEPLREHLVRVFQSLLKDDSNAVMAAIATNESCMLLFLEHVRSTYGGASRYFMEHSNVTEEELERIKKYLIEETEASRIEL